MHNKFFLRCFGSLNFIVFRYVFAAAHNFHFMEKHKSGMKKVFDKLFTKKNDFRNDLISFLKKTLWKIPLAFKAKAKSAFVYNLCEIVCTCRG